MTQRRVTPRQRGRFAGASISLREGLLARLLHGYALVGMLVGVLLLASCSTEPSTPSTSETSSQPNGSLTIAVNFRSGGLDPQDTTPNTLQTMVMGVYDNLIELTPDAKPRPGIAERWEITPDGKTHTFFIRKGVKFHDGSDLTGADVKFSIERLLEPKSTHQDAATWRAMIDGVDLKDDYTVALRLKQPLFQLLNGLEDFSGAGAVLPKKYIETRGVDYFMANPMGSGPWKVVKWQPGNRLELEAQESHWRAVPKFKNITILNVPEEGTKVAMLKTGELDIAEVSPDSVAGLKLAGIRIFAHEGGAQFYAGTYYDLAQPDKWALGNVKVRKALSLATDRKEMGDKLYGGYAEPSAVFYVRSTAYFWDPNQLKPDPYDPEGAKKLLVEAGYSNGFPLKIWDMGGGSILTTFNQALAGYYRKVGINSQIQNIEQAAMNALVRPTPKPEMFDSIRAQITGGGFFNFEKMTIAYHSKKGGLMNTNNPKLDELIDKVPLTADPAEKKKIALEAAVMAKNDYYDFSILEVRTLIALGSKVGDFNPTKGMAGFAASFETIAHAK